MSRKAKVLLEEKKTWSRPRMDVASLGYNWWKVPADSLIKSTLVVIEHLHEGGQEDSHHVARRMRSAARDILINPSGFQATNTTNKK